MNLRIIKLRTIIGAAVGIFLGLDSEARELRAELGEMREYASTHTLEVIHSFHALTGRGHNILREKTRK